MGRNQESVLRQNFGLLLPRRLGLSCICDHLHSKICCGQCHCALWKDSKGKGIIVQLRPTHKQVTVASLADNARLLCPDCIEERF